MHGKSKNGQAQNVYKKQDQVDMQTLFPPDRKQLMTPVVFPAESSIFAKIAFSGEELCWKLESAANFCRMECQDYFKPISHIALDFCSQIPSEIDDTFSIYIKIR